MNSLSLLGGWRPPVGRSGAVPPAGVRRFRRAASSRLAFQLALLALVCTFGACASSSLDDMSPEIRRDASGKIEPAVVQLKDYRARPPIVFLLSNKPGTQLVARLNRGQLPVTHKEILDERMGQLVAYMRYQGFFDHAQRVGNRPPSMPTTIRRALTLWTGEQDVSQTLDWSGMADVGRRNEVLIMSEISKAIRHISNQTPSLKVDPTGRSAQDFLNQPGLRHGSRGKR